jgi:hypothetical protein
VSPKPGIKLFHHHPRLSLQPGRHHQAVTELSGRLPAEEDKIITPQVPENLPGVQPVQNLSPVKPDELLRIGDFH